jgi:hypothetical protein
MGEADQPQCSMAVGPINITWISRTRIYASLLVLAGIPSIILLALWLRSYFVADYIGRNHLELVAPDHARTDVRLQMPTEIWSLSQATHADLVQNHSKISIARGHVLIESADATCPNSQLLPDSKMQLVRHSFRPVDELSYWRCVFRPTPMFIESRWPPPWHGFDFATRTGETQGVKYHRYSLLLPIWPAFALTLPAWVWVLRELRRRRRLRAGLCLRCGYDLRASKDRCPECGHPITPSSNPTPRTRPGTSS